MEPQIKKESIFEIINKCFTASFIFESYTLSKQNFYVEKSPTLSYFYDSEFISKELDRWFFLRLQTISKQCKFSLWINFLEKKLPVNFDVETFLLTNTKESRDLKKMFYFNFRSVEDLEISISKIIKYLQSNPNSMVVDVIRGRQWKNLDFDWHGYK